MTNLLIKSEQPESSESLGKAVIQLIEENLDLQQWYFKLSYTDFTNLSSQVVIYDSPFCRISFSFSRQRLPKYDELRIEYGRLHAPDDEPFMEWNGQTCRCWHGMLEYLRFLDGLSSQEAVTQDNDNKQLPRIVREFNSSNIGRELLEEYPPKYAVVLEASIWNYYGQKLFDLFDLRRPDLWDEYRRFLKEYYRLLDMKASYGPPYENVC